MEIRDYPCHHVRRDAILNEHQISLWASHEGSKPLQGWATNRSMENKSRALVQKGPTRDVRKLTKKVGGVVWDTWELTRF